MFAIFGDIDLTIQGEATIHEVQEAREVVSEEAAENYMEAMDYYAYLIPSTFSGEIIWRAWLLISFAYNHSC